MHVIYGGTFDPVHHGHLRLALEVADALAVNRVNLMPCHIPPHRESTGASSGQRLELIRLAITGEPRLAVDDRELRRKGSSYTADTLRQLRQELGPDEPLVMVVGTDAFASFDCWRDWSEIPDLAHIVVVQRPGAELLAGSKAASLLGRRRTHAAASLHDTACGLMFELTPPLLDISATGIRQRIARGHSPRYLTPDSVWQQIQVSGLYGACPDGNF